IHGPVEDARLARLIEKDVAALANPVLPTHAQEAAAMVVVPEPTEEEIKKKEEQEGKETGRMEVDGQDGEGTRTMTKTEKERLFLSRNAFKKKMKARSQSVGRGKKYVAPKKR
ncbi:hypothetical protein HKX48_000969, partial [Thoreauomyces humboldtii]